MDIKFPQDACTKREETSLSDKCVFVLPSVEAAKTGDESKHMTCSGLFFEAATDCVCKGEDGYTVKLDADSIPLYAGAEYGYPMRGAMFVPPYITSLRALQSASNYVSENYRSAEVRVISRSQDTVSVHMPKSRFTELGEDYGQVFVTDPKGDASTFFYCDKAHMKKTRGGYDITLPEKSVLMLFLATDTEEELNIRETEPIKVKDLAAICEKRKRAD